MLLGTRAGIPNLLWFVFSFVFFITALVVFWRTAWPHAKQAVVNFMAQTAESRPRYSLVAGGFAGLYVASLILPGWIIQMLVLLFLLGCWNIFCRSLVALSLFARYLPNETTRQAVRHGVGILIGIGLVQLLLPDLVENLMEGLGRALLFAVVGGIIVVGVGGLAVLAFQVGNKIRTRLMEARDEI